MDEGNKESDIPKYHYVNLNGGQYTVWSFVKILYDRASTKLTIFWSETGSGYTGDQWHTELTMKFWKYQGVLQV